MLATAQQFAAAFETRRRDNGEEFTCLADTAPDWMRDIVQRAHGDMLPDDWRYRFIRDVADAIAETLAYDGDIDFADERIDGLVPVYNNERAAWLASNLTRAGYCDDAASGGLVSADAGIFERIGVGIRAEINEVWDSVISGLRERAEGESADA